MAIQGQRFSISLGDEFEGPNLSRLSSSEQIPQGFNVSLVGDIRERVASTDAKPPSPPRLKTSQSGFPAHKTRTGSSRSAKSNGSRPDEHFRPRGKIDAETRQSPRTQVRRSAEIASSGDVAGQSTKLDLKDPSIDEENKQKLAAMSDQEIEEARQEVMTGLRPSLLEKLLKKANLDEGHADSNVDVRSSKEALKGPVKASNKKVTFEDPKSPISSAPDSQGETPIWDPDAPPLHPPPDLYPASAYPSSLPQPPNMHFPIPPQAPDLDPSHPGFFSALHSTYFPNLPADPSAMAWMTPLSPNAEEESSYSPLQETHTVSALRFDFRGHLLPPRLSAQIPSTKGLHHHAHVPSSAGYTVPELSHLARSTYPAQRCIAYQTLGRILYRLGRGDFGQEGEDLCEGLWQLMEQGKVVDQLVEAAAKGDSGNRSIWITATEAVWLWRKGGGRRWRGR